MLRMIQDLLAHQAWADAMFFRAWKASGHGDDEELRRRTAHLVDVQEGFLGVVQGDVPDFEEGPPPALEVLEARCRAAHAAFADLSRTLDDGSLRRVVRVPWFPDPPCLVSVAEALTQACLHTQQHRGQNLTRLKALGGTAKNVDYILWLWRQRPEPRWE